MIETLRAKTSSPTSEKGSNKEINKGKNLSMTCRRKVSKTEKKSLQIKRAID